MTGRWCAGRCGRAAGRGWRRRSPGPARSARTWGSRPTPPKMVVDRTGWRAVGAHALVNLERELARRGQDQRPDGRGPRRPRRVEQLQHGQHEGGRLAGAGLGAGEHVAAGEHERDGLGLDGGGFGVALVRRHGGARAQPKVIEGHGEILLTGPPARAGPGQGVVWIGVETAWDQGRGPERPSREGAEHSASGAPGSETGSIDLRTIAPTRVSAMEGAGGQRTGVRAFRRAPEGRAALPRRGRVPARRPSPTWPAGRPDVPGRRSRPTSSSTTSLDEFLSIYGMIRSRLRARPTSPASPTKRGGRREMGCAIARCSSRPARHLATGQTLCGHRRRPRRRASQAAEWRRPASGAC